MKKEVRKPRRKKLTEDNVRQFNLTSNQGAIIFDDDFIDVKTAPNSTTDINVFMLALYELMQEQHFCKALIDYYYLKLDKKYEKYSDMHVKPAKTDVKDLSMKEINKLITEILDGRD